tara:strand:+ start:739 stop:1029 length:291 start_codon:yes stop_codon:yes gene_type:complete
MALKTRKKRKEYTIEEMIKIVNLRFITEAAGSDVVPSHFTIGSACFEGEIDKIFIMCDSRENSYDPNQWDNMLPTYYGATILEVVTKCFEDRANHG